MQINKSTHIYTDILSHQKRKVKYYTKQNIIKTLYIIVLSKMEINVTTRNEHSFSYTADTAQTEITFWGIDNLHRYGYQLY